MSSEYNVETGEFDTLKCSWNSLMRFYASQVAVSLIESGSKGILSTLHEFAIVIKERHTVYVKNSMVESMKKHLDALKSIADSSDKKTKEAISDVLAELKKVTK